MTLLYDEAKLLKALAALPKSHAIAFAASCCERLWPNYEAFAQIEGWGQPAVLRNTLDNIWLYLKGQDWPTDEIDRELARCEALIPDSDDFNSLLTPAAQRASAAICYTLQCCLDGDASRAALPARLSVEATELFLDAVNDPDTGPHLFDPTFAEWLKSAPLMLAELAKQEADLAALNSVSALDEKFLDDLRASNARMGIRPRARGLVKAEKTDAPERPDG